jgi:hypothetical protein
MIITCEPEVLQGGQLPRLGGEGDGRDGRGESGDGGHA